MKKVNEYDKFLNEKILKPNYTKEKIKDLISKAKFLIPKDKMESFIEDNEEEIKEVSDLITDEDGKIDFSKVKDFFNSNLKKKK